MKDLKELFTKKAVNPAQVVAHPDVIELVEFCAQEKEDYKAVLEFAQTRTSKRIAQNIERLFIEKKNNTHFWLDTNNNDLSQSEFNHSLEAVNNMINAHFWDKLKDTLQVSRFFSTKRFESLWLVVKEKCAYVDKHIEFTLENIEKIFSEIAKVYSSENYISTLDVYKKIFEFNFMKNGNLEIKLVYREASEQLTEEERKDYYYKEVVSMEFLAKGLVLNISEDWSNPLLLKNLDELDFNEDGIQYKNMDKHETLKLNKELAKKFSEITGITA